VVLEDVGTVAIPAGVIGAREGEGETKEEEEEEGEEWVRVWEEEEEEEEEEKEDDEEEEDEGGGDAATMASAHTMGRRHQRVRRSQRERHHPWSCCSLDHRDRANRLSRHSCLSILLSLTRTRLAHEKLASMK
jgi:hypothetical protein